MKKIMTACLCLLLIVVLVTTAYGAAGFSVSASDKSLSRGDTVTLTFSVSSGDQATSYGLMLSYDKAVFELVNGNCTVPGTLVSSFNNGFAFLFQNPTAYSGTVGTITLKVKDNAALGSYTVSGSASVKNGDFPISASGCSVTLSVGCDHKYSPWTDLGDGRHTRTCSVCNQPQTENHTWDDGKVTKPANCKEPGSKLYTCTACNATKPEEIPQSTTHTYTNDCDPDCNVCGLTRTITHKYSTKWSKDQNGHWHACTVCKLKKDEAAHTPGPEATESSAQTCTTCGYVIKAALGHKHNYATTWTTDEQGHWHACSGCDEKGDYVAHDFENACDPDCSICKYQRDVGHSFTDTWEADGEKHWHACSGCGLKQDEAVHTPGPEATETVAQTCTVCGYELAPALGGGTEPTEAEKPAQEQNTDTGSDKNELWSVIAMPLMILGVLTAAGVALLFIFKKR